MTYPWGKGDRLTAADLNAAIGAATAGVNIPALPDLPAGAPGATDYLPVAHAGATYRAPLASTQQAINARLLGAKGNGTTDDTAAIQAALDAGDTFLPPGNYLITDTLRLKFSGQVLFGLNEGWRTVIEWAGGDKPAIEVAGLQHCAIRGLHIRRKAGQPISTVSCGVNAISNTFSLTVEHCRIEDLGQGLNFLSATYNKVISCNIRRIRGPYGIRYKGTEALPCYGLRIIDLGCDDAGAGNTGVIWIAQDSWAYSLDVTHAPVLGGGVGLAMMDTDNTGTSYPRWAMVLDLQCDHNSIAGVDLSAGHGFYCTTSWFGSCLAGPAIRTRDAWMAECVLSNSRVMGNIQHGLLLGAGVDTLVSNCAIGDNSAGNVGVYDGIHVNAGVSRFSVVGCRIGDIAGVAGNAQAYGIRIEAGASNEYQILGNVMSGNVTGNISDGGTGARKVVQSSGGTGYGVAYSGDVQAARHVLDTWGFLSLNSGNPVVNYDANDFRLYNRSTDTESLSVGGVTAEDTTAARKRFYIPVSFPAFAFAALPAAAANNGNTVRISDRSNRLATSDGTTWRWAGDGTAVS